MRNHVMIDFETLSTKPTAAVVSVGLVRFSREEILAQEYMVFSLKEQCEKRIVDGDTLNWWFQQSNEAKAVFEQSHREGMLINHALPFVLKMYQRKDLVWGNGANFDPVIMESLFVKANQEIPWKFWDVRCYRTLKSLFPIEQGIEKPLVKHNALDDALFQARAVQAFLTANPELDK